MTTAEIKAILNAVRETERRYRLAKDKYAAYMQLLTCGKTVRYKNDSAVHERDGNPVERAYCQLADYETEMNRILGELVAVRKEAEKYIDSLDDSTEQEVITRRYLMYQRWEDIAEDMGYEPRQIYRLHGRSLQKMCH